MTQSPRSQRPGTIRPLGGEPQLRPPAPLGPSRRRGFPGGTQIALAALALFAAGCGVGGTEPAKAPAPPAVEQLPVERFREIAGGLDAAEPATRRKTVEAVSRLGPAAEAFRDRLVKLAESDPDPALRRLAEEAIARLPAAAGS